jgi:hypothetical protein
MGCLPSVRNAPGSYPTRPRNASGGRRPGADDGKKTTANPRGNSPPFIHRTALHGPASGEERNYFFFFATFLTAFFAGFFAAFLAFFTAMLDFPPFRPDAQWRSGYS